MTNRLVETQLFLHLLRSVISVTSEDEALAALSVANLVDLSHGAKGDETDESVLGDQRKSGHKVILESSQVLGVQTGVNHKQEDGVGSRSGQNVLNSGALGSQLVGQVFGSNVSVLRRQLVSRQTERTDPGSGSQINLAEGVEHSSTGGRHAMGSYCSTGRLGFSFRGVYRAEMGTTVLEASIRVEGMQFQENRTPSFSSNSSKSWVSTKRKRVTGVAAGRGRRTT